PPQHPPFGSPTARPPVLLQDDSRICYSRGMGERGTVLELVMRETGTSQSELSRLSGVHQPSISQFLSGRVDLSDGQLDRLLSCMGRRLEVVRSVVEPELT